MLQRGEHFYLEKNKIMKSALTFFFLYINSTCQNIQFTNN